MPREHFKSRLGFILISAGCAIGLGNVWRFPYVVGEYGGAAFVLLYLVFLAILGIPILVMELAVGRASQRSVAQAFDRLEPSKTKWHYFKWVALAGQYLLMMFYTTVAGWMLSYIPKMATANLATMDAAATNTLFSTMLANPAELVFWMFLACAIALFVCHLGLQKGVERVTKVLMVCLLALIAVLVIRSVTLEGAGAGIAFYLNPDFSKIFASPGAFSDAVFAALFYAHRNAYELFCLVGYGRVAEGRVLNSYKCFNNARNFLLKLSETILEFRKDLSYICHFLIPPFAGLSGLIY